MTMRHILVDATRSLAVLQRIGILRVRCLSDYKAHQESFSMQKLMRSKGSRKKRKWYEPHIAMPFELPGIQQKMAPRRSGISPGQAIRVKQLSHVLYNQISQLINSEELSPEIVHKQVLITSVKMNNDFTGINVFWDSNRSDAQEVEVLLNNLAKKLRSLLISYHTLGRIPPVFFVKESKTDLSHLFQLLEVADYGPDYFPSTAMDRAVEAAEAEKTKKFETRTVAENNTNADKSGTFVNGMHDSDPHCSSNHSQVNHFQAESRYKAGEMQLPLENKFASSSVSKSFPFQSTSALAGSIRPGDQSAATTFKFRSNIYGLPHDILMNKVASKKGGKKPVASEASPQSESPSSKSLPPAFDVKKLRNQIDKINFKTLRKATRQKQRLMADDADEVRGMIDERD